MALGARRSDTGRSSSEHMRESLASTANAVRQGERLRPERLGGFCRDPHRARPSTDCRDIPLGLVTVIVAVSSHCSEGNRRMAHSGATPFAGAGMLRWASPI
jgi:hypothetical protein